jgi:hypothetical protein
MSRPITDSASSCDGACWAWPPPSPTLTLWFASPAGFWGGLIIGIVVFAVGYAILVRHEEKQPLNLWTEGR